MIVSRSPFRLTLGGGGTDLPEYAKQFTGYVVSIAIAKYIYIVISEPLDSYIRLKYSISETVENVEDLKHDIAREILKLHNVRSKIDIVSLADVPAGTGLGSSSCYAVGLLNAIHTYKRDFIPLLDLAKEACHVEMNLTRHIVGYQDQYMAAVGGLNRIVISKDRQVGITPCKISESLLEDLNKNMLLFYTGRTRDAKIVLQSQVDTINKSNKALDSLHAIKDIGIQVWEALLDGNLSKVGLLFDAHWEHKKKTSPIMTNKYIDDLYNEGKKQGAISAKLSGAGGNGGFMLFYVEKDHGKFIQNMEKTGLKRMKYSFDMEGSKILLNT